MTGETVPLPEVPNVPNVPVRSTTTVDAAYFDNLARQVGKIDHDTAELRPELPVERDARRLGERLPAGYKPTSGSDLTFDPRLAYEIALGIDKPHSVFTKYGYSPDQAAALVATPAFITTVKKYQEEVMAGGVSFRLKAKIQAEDLLTHSYLIATDPEAPLSVRADLIKWTARVAGLEPKEEKGSGQAGGFTLNIQFAGDRPAAAIEGEVIDG